MNNVISLLWLFFLNSLWQIALIAGAFAGMYRSMSKLRPQTQHTFYRCALVVALATPVLNIFVHETPLIGLSHFWKHSSQPAQVPSSTHQIHWYGYSSLMFEQHWPQASIKVVLAIWVTLTLLGLARLSAGLYGIRCLRHTSAALAYDEFFAIREFRLWRDVTIFTSNSISGPVTAGFWNPSIFLPTDLFSEASTQERIAMLSHERAHIARHDFAWHIGCEFLTLPFWWHPGIRYLRSQLSQTRELVCDEEAATVFGDRRGYAQLLLTLAKRSVNMSSPCALGLGLFQQENLERRVHTLLQKHVRHSLRRVALTIALSATVLVSSAMLAHSFTLQRAETVTVERSRFAGRWLLQFKGNTFATIVLIPLKAVYTGSMTNGNLNIDADGRILSAEAQSGSSKVASTPQNGSELTINVADASDTITWQMVLKDANHAEVTPVIPSIEKVESFQANKAD